MIRTIHGDCKTELKELADNSVDSIVTDPPYELGFMGKKWDSTGIAYDVDMWKECLRVLKPGGHLLAFGGTRTYHRMTVAIEDAGFEIRDMIEWVYGAGFPKSLNIGKKVAQLQGNERESLGIRDTKVGMTENTNFTTKNRFIEETKGTSEWEGWGTALKPSHESICVAHKALNNRSVIYYIMLCVIKNITEILICQLPSNVQIVELSSKLSPVEQNEVSGIAVWNVVNNINTQESLSVLMDTLQLKETENLNLNTVLLCLNFLKEICEQMSIFTTEMETSLIIELKTLSLLLSADILVSIIQVKEMSQDGKNANACFVENYLNVVSWKWNTILTHSAQENVISMESNLNFVPNHEPICMARKPLAEKTVAKNVLKWGTGGINIDESRVNTITEKDKKGWRNENSKSKSCGWLFQGEDYPKQNELGRFPANLIHDNSEEVRECFPETKSTQRTATIGGTGGVGVSTNFQRGSETSNFSDSGNASRYFKSIIYQAKASKKDRNEGLEKFEENATSGYSSIHLRKNHHPTVKPTKLMQYLCRLVTPSKGIVLDPFMGSGSTGKGAVLEGFDFIGIEREQKYIEIARARIQHAEAQQKLSLFGGCK